MMKSNIESVSFYDLCSQVDEEPSIRANTTLLLGNLAKHLGEVTCKKVLLNAFTRALKDVFPPARIAALRAIMATRCVRLQRQTGGEYSLAVVFLGVLIWDNRRACDYIH